MKKVAIIVPAILFFLIAVAWQPSPVDPRSALDQVQKDYLRNMEYLSQDIQTYYDAATSLTDDAAAIATLQQAHLKARLSYKQIEYLIEYFDAAGAKQVLNGAPLPKTEPKVAELRVIEPKGLQVLDELAFDDAPFGKKDELIYLIKQLQSNYEAMRAYQGKIKITHRHIIEAIRQEIIRISFLGLTGFDTPGSVNALPEALIAWHSTFRAYNYYDPMVHAADPKLSGTVKQLIKDGANYLASNPDFDTFDRATFIKDYANPLYGLLLDVHHTLQIETAAEAGLQPTAVDYEGRSMFSESLFNKDYFSGLTDEYAAERRELGRTLFYDPILSESLKLSCGSCHDPQRAFTDGQRTSLSHAGMPTRRNAPTLINAVYAEKYFLDLREERFETQMNHVVSDHNEFNSDFIEIIDKLAQSEEYMAMINAAYPTYGLSQHAVTNAISHYVASLTGMDSPFDQYLNGEEVAMSESAINGFNIFMGKGACGTCHFAPSYSGIVPPLYMESESEVLGVPATPDTADFVLDPDLGRQANAKPLDEADIYAHSFKTVTVRNIEHTAPYMHNGVYATLEEVMDFYNKGGGIGHGLELDNQTLLGDPLNLTATEIADVISFMKELNDLPSGLAEHPQVELPTFSDPALNNRQINNY